MFGFVIIYWWCHGWGLLGGVISGFVNRLWVGLRWVFSGFIGGVVGGLKMISLAILLVVL
jgi:hypothetical protein